MGSSTTLLVLLFVLGNGVAVTMGRFLRTEVEVIEEDLDEELFLVKESKLVANTSAGKMVVFYDRRVPERLQIATTTMEPRSLMIHRFLAATNVMYVVSGEANLGYIDQNNQRLTQIRLREGDVYQIPAGSAFYIANEESDQKLEIISGIEPSQGLGDDKITEDPPRSYNLNKRKPDFENKYGWRVAVDGSQYHPLKSSGIGIYHEYLSAGSMMAPRVNPMATEYGIVVNGSGRVQVLFPNGSNAMDTNITKGDVFFIPSNFPYCEIAHKGESLELLGFTTSAQRNRPVVLVGARSVVRTMEGPELATSFGVSKEEIKHLVSAQHESVILPTP
ncbi:RmlC-like jelly roll fold [Vigna unguiculata]|uniref:RmlC-like jelly roll fold n=1 Tax=Vigna unguiculata TaxID=3917 RepID=A0A4D6N676_VIGUN|nr:RmlC-like jelly roll fold [Vigna unguiculata]